MVGLVIPSCDRYKKLWKGFFTLKERYWQCPFKTYLISENPDYPGVESIKEDSPSWATRLKNALSKIKEDYIFILFDDYFLTERVDTSKIMELFNIMKKENVLMMNVNCPNLHRGLPNQPQFKEYSNLVNLGGWEYKVNFQPGIWRKDILSAILREGEDPWQTELNGEPRARNLNPFVGPRYGDLIKHKQVYQKGNVRPGVGEFLKKENIII